MERTIVLYRTRVNAGFYVDFETIYFCFANFRMDSHCFSATAV
ncbi:hypothetical protein L506_4446 [Bordetella bronchiseptica GA96-01]|nr:hypothetical protein L572_4456 [Bordetella bronchiseptica 345]KDC40514.1 hypothetical protein L506_4446 [Bordetella bronchiseptica GA96-01]